MGIEWVTNDYIMGKSSINQDNEQTLIAMPDYQTGVTALPYLDEH